MTTMHVQDILRKKSVPQKYTPNSYRIFCEDIGNNSVSDTNKYSYQAPQIYTQPLIVPAQAIEDRNKPHAGRAADFLRENAHTLNEPINNIKTKNASDNARWWEWNLPKEDPNWKKKRSQSSTRPNEDTNYIDGNNFQTTYQKEHAFYGNTGGSAGAQRHSFNPNGTQALGIIPINDLTGYAMPNEQQRVFTDKISFEQAYDSRNENNYPMRGRRHGAFVEEQIEPKPKLGTKTRQDMNKGTSVWDAMHQDDKPIGNPPHVIYHHQKPPSVKHDSLRNQRRDPIGYFEDSKFGGSLGTQQQQPQYEQQNPMVAVYQPSWNQETDAPNNLLENAMRYQN